MTIPVRSGSTSIPFPTRSIRSDVRGRKKQIRLPKTGPDPAEHRGGGCRPIELFETARRSATRVVVNDQTHPWSMHDYRSRERSSVRRLHQHIRRLKRGSCSFCHALSAGTDTQNDTMTSPMVNRAKEGRPRSTHVWLLPSFNLCLLVEMEHIGPTDNLRLQGAPN